MTDPEGPRAIAAGRTGRIAVAFVEWAGSSSQKLVIDWTLIGDAQQAAAFGARIAEAARDDALSHGVTAINGIVILSDG